MKSGTAALALAVVALSAAVARLASGVRSPVPPTVRTDASAAALDSATRSVRGTLTPRARLAIFSGGHPARMLVVLRSRDRLTCEDLGRQLRELLHREGSGRRAAIVTEDSAVGAYREFARRERLHVPVLPLAAGEVLAEYPRLSTPAVLLIDPAMARAAGVSHPIRFPNLRMRSFATELEPLLADSL